MSLTKVVNKQILKPGIKMLEVEARAIVARVQPGQFMNILSQDGRENLPLTVSRINPQKGTIWLVFKEEGKIAEGLGRLMIGDPLPEFLGPLGNFINIEKVGTVVCVANGIGIAQILPVCQAYKEKGNRVIGIIEGKNKAGVILEPQIRLACTRSFVTTEDGSYQRRGFASGVLEQYLSANKVNLIYSAGSVEMMRKVCAKAELRGIRAIVRLNLPMTDCAGICGACRVSVGGQKVLACVEGPAFDGTEVDFDDLRSRMEVFDGDDVWYSRRVMSSPSRNGSGTFMRFLSGILKK